MGSVIFFLMCGIRAVVRYDWLAASLAALLLTLQEGSIRNSENLWLDLPIYVGIFGAFTFMLLRMGMVPAIVGIFVINLSSRLAVPLEPGSWYTPYMVSILLLFASISLFAFWRSVSRPARTEPERSAARVRAG
jgi:hypothetical protein